MFAVKHGIDYFPKNGHRPLMMTRETESESGVLMQIIASRLADAGLADCFDD